MNIVTFPNLNLELNINSVAFKIGNIDIYYYAICIVIAIIISILLCYKAKEKFEIDFSFAFDTLIYCLIFGIIGARIFYILFNLKHYLLNPLNIVKIRNGGLAIYGGLITGFFVIIYRCKKNKVNFKDFLDFIVPYVALAQSIGRCGNFFNIEAYGIETNSFFKMGIEIGNKITYVHPTFLYESVFNLILFFILKKLQKKRKYKGQIVLIYIMMYSFARFFIENLRTDSLMFFSVKISCLISIILFAFSTFILILKKNKCKKMSKKIKK